MNGFDIGYEYNDVGSVTKVIYPGVGKEVIYTYDQLNRIKTVTAWTGDVTTYNYDSAGHLVSVDNFNGIQSVFAYDKADRVIKIKNQRTDSSILTSYDFTLDGNGNKTKIAKNEPQSLTLGVSDTPFTYNFEKNRLLTAGSTTFAYDDEGQLAGKNTDAFTFDYDHSLTAINGVSTAQFTYDARDARVKAVRNGVETKYIYDAGGNLLAEADSAGVIQQYYIYGAGLLASITPTDDVYTYHYNGNGNTIAITDQTQQIINSYSYTPYGQITTEVENITNPFKFAGQFGIMYESGDIYYMRARYYAASVGRFISEDPSGFVDGPNLFAYVGGNPTNFIDPDGEEMMPLGFPILTPMILSALLPINPPTPELELDSLGDIVTQEIKAIPSNFGQKQGESNLDKEKASGELFSNKKKSKTNGLNKKKQEREKKKRLKSILDHFRYYRNPRDIYEKKYKRDEIRRMIKQYRQRFGR